MPAADVASELARLELGRPRWVLWRASSARLVGQRLRPRAVWDLGAVGRLLAGGRRDDPGAVWSYALGLPLTPPAGADLVLLDTAGGAVDGDPAVPVRPDGSLHPEWAAERGGDPGRWAQLALQVQDRQERALLALPDPRPDARAPHLRLLSAWSESAASVLAVELGADGLPFDRTRAERLLGPRPVDIEADRAARDAPVLALLPDRVDLRNPAQVREALLRKGIVVPDTRSWRLEPFRRAHPLVDALLAWRKAERLATTYGWGWLDAQVGVDGRLRGQWSASDGGAGRMTAGAGLHNLPAELRPAVVAEPGHVLVRADLGQIEPRVLAAVSGDAALAAAARAEDMYAPVASQLGCDRPTAKVAVLAAMYGQTSGAAGQALQQMERAYPAALAFLRAAEESGRTGVDLRTHGGRLVRVGNGGAGRYARNAVVQGAAAELFKAWAATVRNGLPAGSVVLCLHDELLLHVPVDAASGAADLLRDGLQAVAAHWAAGSGVRFVADVTVVRRWSDAKG